MEYGYCKYALVALREEQSENSEMVTQLFYGEEVIITKEINNWYFIRAVLGEVEGYVLKNQIFKVQEDDQVVRTIDDFDFSADFLSFLTEEGNKTKAITMGAVVSNCHIFGEKFNGEIMMAELGKTNFSDVASLYLDAPYIKGGQTILGIDSLGLNQMVYRFLKIDIPRDIELQRTCGENVPVEEIKDGDLVFFKNWDNPKDVIHSAMVYDAKRKLIIHCCGNVRLDELTNEGLRDLQTEQMLFRLDSVVRIIQ